MPVDDNDSLQGPSVHMTLRALRAAQYENGLVGDKVENAKSFLYAYQQRMGDGTPHTYHGKDAQEYHLWRTGWLIACLDQLPPWDYQYQSAPEKEARVSVALHLRQRDLHHANSLFGLRELL